MKNLILLGFLLLGISAILYYIQPNFSAVKLFEPMTLMGILAGIGIGLIIGGIVGYSSKGTAVREAQKKQEVKQLRLEKHDLEKQAAELAKQQTVTYMDNENNNPQNY